MCPRTKLKTTLDVHRYSEVLYSFALVRIRYNNSNQNSEREEELEYNSKLRSIEINYLTLHRCLLLVSTIWHISDHILTEFD